MATNLGNTRNAVEKNHHAWRPPLPPSWNFLLDPRFPLRATRGPRTRQALISRACLALHALQRPPCAYALITGQLNLWYPAPGWSRASYHRLLLQQSQNRRRLHTSHSHDFLIYSVWERMLTPPSQWRVLSMCGRCLGRITSSLGLFPLKMGGAGGTPPIFWGKSPEDKVVRRKRGMRIHRRASKQERDFFLFFPALSAQPSRSLARKAMSELG